VRRSTKMRHDKAGWYHWELIIPLELTMIADNCRAQCQDDMRNRFPEKEGRDADQK
jgi:hypothetical protein